ncbi:MAG: hypothetical protein IPL08_13670 [Saprospiraceae bacterium]|nr:hypothetical protein [Saprospiraceae bacterium]
MEVAVVVVAVAELVPAPGNNLTLEVRTDNYPAETTWNIKNSSGTILYSGGPYSVSTH